MKKILTVLFSVCMVLCLAFGFAACNGGGSNGAVGGGGIECEHNLVFMPGINAGCYSEGVRAHYVCQGACGGFFADANAQTRLEQKDINLGYYHANSTHYEETEATCSQLGHVEYTDCPTCNRYLDKYNNGINASQNPLYTIKAHNFSNGICTVCNSHEPSVGLEIDNNGYVCGLGDCQETEIVIPNSYEKDGKLYPVLGIARYAFDDANGSVNITSVRITKGIKEIGANAFYCIDSLQTVIIEGNVEFERNAFYNCSNIKTIELGEGITNLTPVDYPNESVFSNCASSLQYMYLPSTYNSSNLGGIASWNISNFNEYAGAKYLGNQTNPYVFLVDGIDSDTDVTAIHSDCKIIADDAFNGLYSFRLINADLPDGLKIIGKNAFIAANITLNGDFINISKNVEYIGEGAFGGCDYPILVHADNPNYKSINYSLLSKDGKKLYTGFAYDEVNDELLETYVVPDGVEEICKFAFVGRNDLTSVVFPNSLTKIENYAFVKCNKLASITIPSSVEIIGDAAFGTSPIIYVERAREDCDRYSSIWSYGEYEGYDYNQKIVYNCKNNDVAEDGNVYVLTENYIYTIANQKACVYSFGAVMPTGESIVLPESITYKNTVYPVTAIKSDLIKKFTCTSLTIPNCYEEITDIIDEYDQPVTMFNDYITELVIGTGLTQIPVFNMNLTSFKYSGSAESWLNKEFLDPYYIYWFIDNQTKFYVMQSDNFVELTSVVIPSGCTYFGQFGKSDSIDEILVKYGATIESFGQWHDSMYNAFSDDPVIKLEYFEGEVSLSMPKAEIIYAYGAENGSTDIYDYIVLAGRAVITAYKGNAETIVIPQKLGGYDVFDFGTIFKENTTAKTIIILARVKEIKADAFKDCTNLSLVYINGNVGKINTGAFKSLNINTNYGNNQSVDYLTTGIYIGADNQQTESGWLDKAYPVHYSISYDENGILYDAQTKTILRYVGTASTLTIPDAKNFSAIRNYAFKDCSLTEVVISSTIEEIGAGAFENCEQLTSITISLSVYMIGADAFKNTALTSATFASADSWALVEYAQQTTVPIDTATLSNASAAATYLKQSLTDGYVLMRGVMQ